MSLAGRGVRWRCFCLLGPLAVVGCASPTYQYSRFRPTTTEPPPPIVAEQGEPDKVLDGMAKAVDAPARLLSFGSKKTRRNLSPETAQQLTTYLQKNDLGDVHVLVNCYDPKGEWRRLRANTRVAGGWKYTAGTLSLVGYTLFPGRVFGVNRYNPFTDTLSVNSDKPLELLQEAAEAKDCHGQRFPGCYATLTSLPGLALVREVRSASDVLSYARAEKDWETERTGYRTLYPRVGVTGLMSAGPVVSATLAWWANPLLGLGGALVGAGAGYVVETRREAAISASPDAAKPAPSEPAVEQ